MTSSGSPQEEVVSQVDIAGVGVMSAKRNSARCWCTSTLSGLISRKAITKAVGAGGLQRWRQMADQLHHAI